MAGNMNQDTERENFVCNCFWLVNDSNDLKPPDIRWQWGTNCGFIRLDKTVKSGPLVKNRYGNYVDMMYPLLYRYDVLWDGHKKSPKLLFNIYDREGSALPLKSISSLIGIKLYSSGDPDDLESLDVVMHPIQCTPYLYLSSRAPKPIGRWLNLKNPILAYLLKYAPYFRLSQEELLALSSETPYIEK